MELDVRPIPRVRKHATIFNTFQGLEVGESFVLINDHDPLPLREGFNVNFARSFEWEYEESGPSTWRIRITKVASTPLPQVVANTDELAESDQAPDMAGVIWKISVADRDLDSNLIALAPNTEIPAHAGPDLDVMFVVVAGSGQINTEIDAITVQAGDVVWLPERAQREIIAGEHGLRYLTVHKHKTGLRITNAATD